MTTPGIVLCSRLNSKRLPRKALVEVGGMPAIRLLVERVLKTPIPLCVALSSPEDREIYEALNGLDVKFFMGHPHDVLARMFWAAEEYRYDPVIRITHDDILQDGRLIEQMVRWHGEQQNDYTFISDCVRGMDVEVISRSLLERTYKKFHGGQTENLSYLFKHPDVEAKIGCFIPPEEYRSQIHMPLDEPKDVLALRLLFRYIIPWADGREIVKVLNENPEISAINHKPELSIYTCAYNASNTLLNTIHSVKEAVGEYENYEYLLLDDGSTDKTLSLMVTEAERDERIRVFCNGENRGLASSCNHALDKMRGEFCLRLDAGDIVWPDMFRKRDTTPLEQMRADPLLAALYPAYYEVATDGVRTLQQNTADHVGGALMRTRVLREVSFCDGLRHWEGRELRHRLSQRYHVVEFPHPTWEYRRQVGSLSHQKTTQRERHEELICRP